MSPLFESRLSGFGHESLSLLFVFRYAPNSKSQSVLDPSSVVFLRFATKNIPPLFESRRNSAQALFLHSDKINKNSGFYPLFLFILSECRDSNPESPRPKRGMLAVTPHSDITTPSLHDKYLIFK